MKDFILEQVSRIKRIVPVNARIGFYPSSGTVIENFNFDSLPLDFIICSDYDIQEKHVGKIITVKAENNTCLRIILESGLKLDAIFAIQDGFFGGNNFEFVNSVGFLSRLLPALKNKFILVNNARNKSFHDFGSAPVKQIKARKEIEMYRTGIYSTFDRNVKSYKVVKYQKDYPKFKNIKIDEFRSIRVYRKSIWEDQKVLDGIFINTLENKSGKKKESLMHYWPNDYLADKICDINSYTTEGSLIPLLKFANESSMKRIGITPFAERKNTNRSPDEIYQALKEILAWHCKYPEQINFYHLDKGDYEQLYKMSPVHPDDFEIVARPIDSNYMVFLSAFILKLHSYQNKYRDDRIPAIIEYDWLEKIKYFRSTGNIPACFENAEYHKVKETGSLVPPGCQWISSSGRFSAHDLFFMTGFQSFLLWDLKRKEFLPLIFHDLEGIDEDKGFVFCRTLNPDIHFGGSSDPLKIDLEWIEVIHFIDPEASYIDPMNVTADDCDLIKYRAKCRIREIQISEKDISSLYQTPIFRDLKENNIKRILNDSLSKEQEVQLVREIMDHPLYLFEGKDNMLNDAYSISKDHVFTRKILSVIENIEQEIKDVLNKLPF